MKMIKSAKGLIALPCLEVKLVDMNQIVANNYNPNNVPKNNMLLLQESIIANGFCFPVVVIWDTDLEKFVIIDGFHRYTILKDYLCAEQLPVVVLKHDLQY